MGTCPHLSWGRAPSLFWLPRDLPTLVQTEKFSLTPGVGTLSPSSSKAQLLPPALILEYLGGWGGGNKASILFHLTSPGAHLSPTSGKEPELESRLHCTFWLGRHPALLVYVFLLFSLAFLENNQDSFRIEHQPSLFLSNFFFLKSPKHSGWHLWRFGGQVEFKSQFCYLLAMWPWTSDVTTPILCKAGVMTVPAIRDRGTDHVELSLVPWVLAVSIIILENKI